uniref:Uncharacterized protein n=1 Tax=Wuchereria bancrofti TaxID=6293 RepID=A0AAF5Q7P1_WUCBA
MECTFLYDDDDVDELVDQGALSREYCAKCGCKEIMPLTSGMVNAIGIEMNEDFCKLQKRVIEINGMKANIKTVFWEFLCKSIRPGTAIISNLATEAVTDHLIFSFSISDWLEKGALSREYCAKCGCKEIMPLTFISHSLSIDQVPHTPHTYLGTCIGHISGMVNAIGIEMNEDFCKLQKRVIEINGMKANIKTVFWEFLCKSIRPGTAIISNLATEAVTDHLIFSFSISDWLEKIETGHLAASIRRR